MFWSSGSIQSIYQSFSFSSYFMYLICSFYISFFALYFYLIILNCKHLAPSLVFTRAYLFCSPFSPLFTNFPLLTFVSCLRHAGLALFFISTHVHYFLLAFSPSFSSSASSSSCPSSSVILTSFQTSLFFFLPNHLFIGVLLCSHS